MQKKPVAALDGFRLIAALLVVAIHTSPLESLSPDADFLLTRVAGRLAVPFFFMLTGCFLLNEGGVRRFLARTAHLYAAAVALYLPLNVYAGGMSPLEWLRGLLIEGTFYHLWYLPAALLAVPAAFFLHRLRPWLGFGIAGALYLVGLGGDSWYGVVCRAPALASLYDRIFLVFPHTRALMAPLFVLLGAQMPRALRAVPRRRPAVFAAGFAAALAAMAAEALWLRALGAPRHDAMTLSLPACASLLFLTLLSADGARWRAAGELSMMVYVLHPWCVVLTRGFAKRMGMQAVLIENSLGRFLAAAALSFALAAGWMGLCRWIRRRKPRRALQRFAKGRPQGHAARRTLRETSRAWREVDLSAICHNAEALSARLASPDGGAPALMAVVKADAYGHGAIPVARALWRRGVRAFAVATLDEGVALRRAGVRGTILVLGWTPPAFARRLARWRLVQTVADEAHARALSEQGVRLDVHLAIDTGMHRLGFAWDDLEAQLRAFDLPGLRIRGVFSHLCVADSSDEADAAFTREQARRFYAAVRALRLAGRDPGRIHLQASDGILNLPAQPCDFARAGIALYGACAGAPRADLWPALSLRARVASVRFLSPGESAGYGRAFAAARPTKLAVIAIGYADGLPRDLPQRGGEALLHGRRAPMVGRMCMDQLFVDATDVPDVAPGDVVTLIGRDGAACISAVELAGRLGTIPNELLSRLGGRLGTVLRR